MVIYRVLCGLFRQIYFVCSPKQIQVNGSINQYLIFLLTQQIVFNLKGTTQAANFPSAYYPTFKTSVGQATSNLQPDIPDSLNTEYRLPITYFRLPTSDFRLPTSVFRLPSPYQSVTNLWLKILYTCVSSV
jgi:hypothetical protein